MVYTPTVCTRATVKGRKSCMRQTFHGPLLLGGTYSGGDSK